MGRADAVCSGAASNSTMLWIWSLLGLLAFGAATNSYTFLEMQWTPDQETASAGGPGTRLIAGVNYTRWVLTSDKEIQPAEARVMIVQSTMSSFDALSGQCLNPLFSVRDRTPPLDGTVIVPGVSDAPEYFAEYNSPADGPPMVFSQGGFFRLCFSPEGSFGISDGFLVPNILLNNPTTYRVYGAIDTCSSGPGCLAQRRFFCFAASALYSRYLPTGTTCSVFIQRAYAPAAYLYLTWAGGTSCGTEIGQGMEQYNGDWSRKATADNRITAMYIDLGSVDLGSTRADLLSGFKHNLCLCPSYDADDQDQFQNPMCAFPIDYVQKVGVLHGFMVTFLGIDGQAKAQVLAMTRFGIHVDCGGGPHCQESTAGRIKVIDRGWDLQSGSADNMHWETSNGCRTALETEAWYGPTNCRNGNTRLANDCQEPASFGSNEKVFGLAQIRFQPRIYSMHPIAQIFHVCFMDNPPDAGQAADTPNSDAAMQGNPQSFWKIGELVVEPLVVIVEARFVAGMNTQIRIGPPDGTRTSTVHGSEVVGAPGPIIKVVMEQQSPWVPVDIAVCHSAVPSVLEIDGFNCSSSSDCEPRAQQDGNSLLLTNPDGLRLQQPGIFGVCYCEAWSSEIGACEDPEHWMLVGRITAAGPAGNQQWVLDTGMIQSLDLVGYGFSDTDVIRILRRGHLCYDSELDQLDPHVKVCLPELEGACAEHSLPKPDTLTLAEIGGSVKRFNSSFPIVYINSIEPTADGQTILRFTGNPVVGVDDLLVIEDNVQPLADHWTRQRDLTRIVQDNVVGHSVLETMDGGTILKVPISLDPWPDFSITPEGHGRWRQSNKFRAPFLKGNRTRESLVVCWRSGPGQEARFAGELTFQDPWQLPSMAVGLTSTTNGTIAPIWVTFRTGVAPRYVFMTNSTQLRLTFTESNIMAPATSSDFGEEAQQMYDFDQLHEASQGICGLFFRELWSSDYLGFPVPKGCYYEHNLYGAANRIRAIYIVFEAKNGMKENTEYSLVLNAFLKQPMSNNDYSNLAQPLIEVALLSDIYLNPEGILEVQWSNPDKEIKERAAPSSGAARFFDEGGLGGVSVTEMLYGNSMTSVKPANGIIHDLDNLVDSSYNTFGFSFLMRGSPEAPVRGSSRIRVMLMPLTVWSLSYTDPCFGECVGQDGYSCGFGSLPGSVRCEKASVISYCEDSRVAFVRWTDTRGFGCEYFADPDFRDRRCSEDGPDFIPWHGVSAFDACCYCGGGDRYFSNELRLELPATMDPASGTDIIHTVRVWGVGDMPDAGFFPTRWAAEISLADQSSPDFTWTTGPYFRRTPQASWVGTVATLISAEGWGNSHPFKADLARNDFYLRLTIPATMFGVPNPQGAVRARLRIQLPPGYLCRAVLPASPQRAEDGTLEPLPVLPTDSPATGNGALPRSEGMASDLDPDAGSWQFELNQCIFSFGESMALYGKQRLYLRIFAINPVSTLPYTDPENRWHVEFSAVGQAQVLPGLQSPPPEPCAPEDLLCNPNVSLSYYVNPLGLPLEVRSLTPLHPDPAQLMRVNGPHLVTIPSVEEEGPSNLLLFTDRFSVLGRIGEVVIQPVHLHLSAQTTMRIWFVPDLGFARSGILGVDFPPGFVLDNPCVVRDLDPAYYAIYSPPEGSGDPRVFPLGQTGLCSVGPRVGGFDYEMNRLQLDIYGSLVSGRHYGFEAEVHLPASYDAVAQSEDWSFRVFISDDQGFLRDGTFSTGIFAPGVPVAWRPYYTTMAQPVQAILKDLRPFSFVGIATEVTVYPITFNEDVQGLFRVYAPDGFEWAWDPLLQESTFRRSLLVGFPPVATFPAGIPDLPTIDLGTLNIITFNEPTRFLANTMYGFQTYIRVPKLPPRASGNVWYFELGFNDTTVEDNGLSGRAAAASAQGQEIRALRGAKAEVSSSLVADTSLLWLWIEIITPINETGSLEIRVPYTSMKFLNFTDPEDGRDWCAVRVMESLGSLPMPIGLRCRHVTFLDGFMDDSIPPNDPEVRIMLTNNMTGFPPGVYVFEFNVTTPDSRFSSTYVNPAVSNDERADGCGYRFCLVFFSMKTPHSYDWNPSTRAYTSAAIPQPSLFDLQNDYYTSIPIPDFHRLMQFAGIMDFGDPGLDERLATGRDDRPYARSSIIFGFAISSAPTGNTLYIRAPYGWQFDSECEVLLSMDDVFPYPPGMPQPTHFLRSFDSASVLITPWPAAVRVSKCRGDGHNAYIDLSGQPLRNVVHVLRVSVQANPGSTPERNTWSLTYGTETSGALPGFELWSLTNTSLQPVSLAWTPKEAALQTSVTIYFRLTNSLIGQAHADRLLAHLVPYLRLVLPPQFEVVRDGDDQDLQGGMCSAFITKIGDCRRCGVPLDPFSVTCSREINRKHAAWIGLIGAEDITNEEMHTLATFIYNPHIVDAIDGEPRTWQLDTWIGEPHGIWLHGVHGEVYSLDAANISGYFIVEKADFVAEVPAERNGSSLVEPKRFTMRFNGVLRPGDQIELRAPVGFVTSVLVAGLIDRIMCMNFEYTPLLLNRSSFSGDRGPVPDRLPAWAADGAIIEEVPTGSNVTIYDLFRAQEDGFGNSSSTYSLAIRAHCLYDLGELDSEDDELLDRPLRGSTVSQRASHPDALEGGEWSWTSLPQGAELTIFVDRDALDIDDYMNFSQGFREATAGQVLVCLRAQWRVNITRNVTVMERRNVSNMTDRSSIDENADDLDTEADPDSSNLDKNSSNGTSVNGSAANMSNNASVEVRDDEDDPTDAPQGDKMEEEEEDWFWVNWTYEAVVEEDRFYIECFFEKKTLIPTGATAGKAQVLNTTMYSSRGEWWEAAKNKFLSDRNSEPLFGGDGLYVGGPYTFIDPEVQGEYVVKMPQVAFGNAHSNDNNLVEDSADEDEDDLAERRGMAAAEPLCMADVAMLLEVEWESEVNLTQVVEDTILEHLDVKRRIGFDYFPVQAEPDCNGERVLLNLTEDNIHPDDEMLNYTWISFLMAFQNPVRPMYDHENFWTVLHSRNGRPLSSGVQEGWQIISQLMYVQMDLLTEVLRPSDLAVIHIEFVTVNFADMLHVRALWPSGFDFGSAEVLNQESEDPDARRLQDMWQGFTQGVSISSAEGPMLSLAVAEGMGRNQYVRIDIGSVGLPWEGGQAYFDIYTTMFDVMQDEIMSCCDPGMPPDNPADIFRIPHHYEVFTARLVNKFQDNPLQYPVEYNMATRYGEDCIVSFGLRLKVSHVPRPRSLMVIIVRAPPNYVFGTWGFNIREDSSIDIPISYRLQVKYEPQLLQITLPDVTKLQPTNSTQINLRVRTPEVRSNQIPDTLWVVELTDSIAVEESLPPGQVDAYNDFLLEEFLDFGILAGLTPPNVIVTIVLTVLDLGMSAPVQLELYAPPGYSFLSDCLAPADEQVDQAVVNREVILSCRERHKLFGAVALSGAIMMTVDGGVPDEHMPSRIALRILLGDVTPSINKWFMQAHTRDEPAAWEVMQSPFLIDAMVANVFFSAMSTARVSLFLSVRLRSALSWGSHLHFQAPLLYQLSCPVSVLSGPPGPHCTQDNPVLQACYGHPGPNGEPAPAEEVSVLGLPPCDPRHELLLSFTNDSLTEEELSRYSADQQTEIATWFAQDMAVTLQGDESLLYIFNILVPKETPVPTSANIFKVRILDPNLNVVDGKLNIRGPPIRTDLVVNAFHLWWNAALPETVMTVALKFVFQSGVSYAGALNVTTIEIEAPGGLAMGIRRPSDIVRLTEEPIPFVSSWSWADRMPNKLWFSLDGSSIPAGMTFHYAFPVLTPTAEVGIDSNNFWLIKFCGDMPYCQDQVLSVPLPGFEFGSLPTEDLSDEAFNRLTGGAQRRMSHAVLLVLGAMWWWIERAHVI